MKKFVWLALLCNSFLLQAQERKITYDYKLAIHFAPLALLQIDYTFLPGLEYRIRPKTTIVTELGFIVASDIINQNGNNSRGNGVIIRPSVRLYLNERNSFYVQPQVFYKMVTHKINDWLGKDCVNDVPAYEEFKTFKYRRHVVGFNAMGGVLVPLSKAAQSFVDFYFGIGLRKKSFSIVNEPNSCYDRGNNIGIGAGDSDVLPSLPAGVKLIFVIR